MEPRNGQKMRQTHVVELARYLVLLEGCKSHAQPCQLDTNQAQLYATWYGIHGRQTEQVGVRLEGSNRRVRSGLIGSVYSAFPTPGCSLGSACGFVWLATGGLNLDLLRELLLIVSCVTLPSC